MAFVTSKRWVCNTDPRHQEDAVADSRPSGWLHVKWWQDDEILEADVCPRCAVQARKLLKEIARGMDATSAVPEIPLLGG